MKKWIALVLLGGFLSPWNSSAIDLKQSRFTQVVNNVEIISAADQKLHTATVNDIFSMPDLLRTGPDSRAELEATDGTITRVGANTIFSFDPASRTIDLRQGSLLFHSPHGKGGGTIHTGSATASVIGTTIIVTCTPSGGFKLLDLEGQAEVRYLDGLKQTLEPGQLTFILPGGSVSPVVVFRLDTQTKGSALVGGFNTPLDSQSKINSEVTQQLLQVLNGTAADTGYVVGNNATVNSVQVIEDNINNTPEQSSMPPPTVFSTDGSIIGSDHVAGDTMPVNYSPLDPNHVQTALFTPPAGVASISEGLTVFGLGAPDSGFVGNNIDVDTANVDLSPFAGDSAFDIMAAGDMRIWQSVNFDTGTLPGTVGLFAGGDLSIAPDATLEADTGKFVLAADSFSTLNTVDGSVAVPNALENIDIYNDVGDVDVFSIQSLGIYDSEIDAAGKVQIVSDASLNLGTSDDDYIDAGGNVTLFAGILSGGNLDVEYTEIDAGDSAGGGSMNLNAGGNVYIYEADLYAYDGDTGLGNVNIDAGGTADIEGTYIEADGDVNIESGGTLYLGWFDYGSEIYSDNATVNLKSDNGDVDIYDYDIYAYGGDVDIFAGGTADVEDSDIYAGYYSGLAGSVNITGLSVDVYDSDIYAYGGDINITGQGAALDGDTIDIEDSDIYGGYDSDSGGSVNINAYNGDLYLYDNDVYAYGGTTIGSGEVNIYADGTADIEDTYIEADGDVNIESAGTLYLGWNDYGYDIDAGGTVNLKSDNGDVDIDGYEIYTYGSDINGNGINISAGGSVDFEDSSEIYAYDGGISITANGNVYLYDDEMEAGEDSDSPYDMDVTSYGGTVEIDYTDLYANGNVNVESGGTLTLEDNSDLEARNGDVSLLSDNADVDIYNSEVYSDYGNVIINADNGGVYVSDGDIEAGYGSEAESGDVNIRAYNGTADIENTKISAQGNVNIESSGTLTLNYYQYDDNYADNYEIYANNGSVSLKSDSGDVNITGYDIDAYGTDVDGNGVTISAGGNVSVANSYFGLNDNGNITVNAGGNIDVLYTDGSGNGSINLTAGGYVNIYDYSTAISSLIVTAGTYAALGADQYADLYDSSITANGGGVNITGNSAGVDIAATTIAATGDIDVTAGGGNYEEIPYISRHAAPSFVAPHLEAEFVTLGTFTPETFSEPAPISASSDYIVENGATIEETGTIDLEANIDANVYNKSSLTSDSGDVMVNSAGTLEIDSSHLEANDGSVYLVAAGNVSISDSLNESYIYAAYNGDVNIRSSAGTVDIADAYIYGDNKVNIDSFGTLTLDSLTSGYGSGNTVEAYNGDLSLTSDNADVDVHNYYVYSAWGNVNISAGGKVSVSGGEIDTGSYSEAGDLNIQALAGTVDIEGTYVNIAGNFGIYSYGTLTLGNTAGSTIDANGWANLSSVAGDVDVDNYSIYTYGRDIDGNGVTISAAAGGLNLSGDSINSYNGGVDIIAPGASGAIDLEDTYIYTYESVNMESSGAAGDVILGLTDLMDNGGDYNSDNIIYAGGSVSLKSDNKNVVVADYSIGEYYSPIGQDVTISAPNGTVGLENAYVNADGDVSITAGGTSGSDYPGDVSLGLLDYQYDYGYDNNEIDAGGSVLLQSVNADVLVYGYSIYTYGNWDAGNVDIYAYNGQIDLNDSYISAWGDADIESGGTVTVENSSEIDSYGNNGISLTSDNSDVDVYDSSLYAYHGNVDITAVSGSANIDIENDNISAYGNVNVESDGTLTLGNVETGGDTIYAGTGIYLASDSGDVDVYNSTIDGGFDGTVVDVTIEDGSALMSGGVANLKAYGAEISIYAAGNVVIDHTDIDPGGGINVSDATIIADGSDINGNGVNIYSDGYFYVSGYSDTLLDDDIEGNNISISGSTIMADNGGVSIVNDATFSTRDSVGFDLESSTLVYGDITISGSTITANSGNVDIETAGSDLSAVFVDEGSSLSVGDISIYDSTIKAIGGDVTVSAGGSLPETSGSEALTLVGDTILAGGTVSLAAQGDVDVDQDVSDTTALTAGSGDVDVASHNGNMDMENSTVLASGSVALNAAGSVNLKSGSVTATKNVNVNAGTGITINGVAVTADDPAYGTYLTSTAGQTTIQNGSSVTGNLTINSPDGILIDGSRGGTFSGSTMSLTAGNNPGQEININHEDFSTFVSISIAAYTVWIQNTDLGYGSVNLGSYSGIVNVNTGYHVRDINLDNDRWGGSAITYPSQVSSGYSSSSGVHGFAN